MTMKATAATAAARVLVLHPLHFSSSCSMRPLFLQIRHTVSISTNVMRYVRQFQLELLDNAVQGCNMILDNPHGTALASLARITTRVSTYKFAEKREVDCSYKFMDL